MLTVSINYRALTDARDEADKNERLGVQLQSLKDENLALQEEIHTLRTDARVIEREAKLMRSSRTERHTTCPLKIRLLPTPPQGLQ